MIATDDDAEGAFVAFLEPRAKQKIPNTSILSSRLPFIACSNAR
jgi:hypothetical protein